MGVLFLRIPRIYPDEDQGMMLTQIILPQGPQGSRLDAVVDEVRRYFMENEKKAVETCMTIAGASFSEWGRTTVWYLSSSKNWGLRDRSDLRVKAVAQRAMKAFSRYRDSLVFVFAPPAVTELATATVLTFICSTGEASVMRNYGGRNQLLGMAAKDPETGQGRPNGMEDEPQYRVTLTGPKPEPLESYYLNQ